MTPLVLLLALSQPATIPGADFTGAPRERSFQALLAAPYRMVLGLANDEIGYVTPRSQWDAKAPFAYGRKEDQYGEVTPETGSGL